jgi:hypothetical protein
LIDLGAESADRHPKRRKTLRTNTLSVRQFICYSILFVASATVIGCGAAEESGPVSSTKPATNRAFADAKADRGVELADDAMAAPESAPSDDFDLASTEAAKIDTLETPATQTIRKPENKPQMKAGTLTAGSLDDQKNYDDFIKYVRTALQSGERLPQFAQQLQYQRALISVQDTQGRPINNAKVTVFASAENQAVVKSKYQPEGRSESVITLTTGTDGQTMFLPQLDGSFGSNVTEFELQITAQGQTTSQAVSMNQTPWVVALEDVVAELPQKLDLALIIDTTGSMSDELEYLKVEIDSIAQKIKSLYPNVDQRFAVVLYRDHGDEYVTRAYDFTSSLSEFRSILSKQSASGGGDHPEAMDAALERANDLAWRTGDTARVAFLVGDAPPHANDYDRTFAAINSLRKREVALFPIAASGTNDKAEFILRAASFLTLGKYLFLTDHSGVGNAHATPDAPRFNVERLDQLMVRMIASELAGEEVFAEDIIATERKNAATAVEQSQNQNHSNVQTGQHVAMSPMPSAANSESTFGITQTHVRFALLVCCAVVLVGMHFYSQKRQAQTLLS